MGTFFRFMSRELFSVTTLLFVAVPFVMHLSSQPGTGNRALDRVSQNIASVASLVEVEDIKYEIGKTMKLAKKVSIRPARIAYLGGRTQGYKAQSGPRSGYGYGYSINHGPIFIPR